jgi:hypothetical protein
MALGLNNFYGRKFITRAIGRSPCIGFACIKIITSHAIKTTDTIVII